MYRITQRFITLILICILCAAILPTQAFATPQTHPNTHTNISAQM